MLEMTAGPGPLIHNRVGCHRWHPDEFGTDDTRHCWT
jgi:hypothetical protein